VSVNRNCRGSCKLAARPMVCRPRYNCSLRASGELSLVIPWCDDRITTVGAKRAAKRNVMILKRTNKWANEQHRHLLMCKILVVLRSLYFTLVAVPVESHFLFVDKTRKRSTSWATDFNDCMLSLVSRCINSL